MDLLHIIKNLPNAVIVVDTERRVLLSNMAAQQVSGFNAQQIIHRRGGEVLHCANAGLSSKGCGYSDQCVVCKVKGAIERAFGEQADVPAFETEMKIESMGLRFLKLSVTYLANLDGRPQRGNEAAIVTVDDVTDYKLKERLAAANETIGAVCHEMNQPLMALMGYIEILLMDDQDKTLLPNALSQVKRLGQITRKLQSITSYSTRKYVSDRSAILEIEPPKPTTAISARSLPPSADGRRADQSQMLPSDRGACHG